MIEFSFRDYFVPNLLHYSEETQQTEISNTINKENINHDFVPIDLTPEEQEFDNLLIDKLIEVVRNPSMRKDFRQVITRMCKWDASSLFAFPYALPHSDYDIQE